MPRRFIVTGAIVITGLLLIAVLSWLSQQNNVTTPTTTKHDTKQETSNVDASMDAAWDAIEIDDIPEDDMSSLRRRYRELRTFHRRDSGNIFRSRSVDQFSSVNNSGLMFQPKTNIAPIPNTEDGSFSASFVGQFQYIRDTPCFGPNPLISIVCLGQIRLTGRSDKRIICNDIPSDSEYYIDGTTGLECYANCTNDIECAEILLNQDRPYGDGPFGQIYYQCSGPSPLSLTSYMVSSNSEEGPVGCNATFTGASTRNIQIGRVGVSCPSQNGTGQEYVFDYYYFDCSGFADSIPDTQASDPYICWRGEDCDGLDCEVKNGPFSVWAEVQHFQDRCLASDVPISPSPTTVTANTTSSESLLQTSALFQARWAVTFEDDINATETNCHDSGGHPVVKLSCPNSKIELVNETYAGTTVCASSIPGTLECVDGGDAFLNGFTSIVYVSPIEFRTPRREAVLRLTTSRYLDFTQKCSGPELPTPVVEYPASTVFCDGNSAVTKVRHAIQLGIYCGIISDFYWGDKYVECDGLSPQFDYVDELDDNITRFTCSESAEFPVGSSPANNLTVPRLRMGTDEIWAVAFTNDDMCFSIDLAPTARPTTLAPVLTPSPTTLAPVMTPQPSASPVTLPPSMAPKSTAPSNAPMAAIQVTSLAPNIASSSSSERSSSPQRLMPKVSYNIVYTHSGSVVVVCLLGMILWLV